MDTTRRNLFGLMGIVGGTVVAPATAAAFMELTRDTQKGAPKFVEREEPKYQWGFCHKVLMVDGTDPPSIELSNEHREGVIKLRDQHTKKTISLAIGEDGRLWVQENEKWRPT